MIAKCCRLALRPFSSHLDRTKRSEVDGCKGIMWWQKTTLGDNSFWCINLGATKLAISGYQGVEAKIGLVHRD